jgi:hypothetical protein
MTSRSVIFSLALALACPMLPGCRERVTADLTNAPEYKALAGARYQVIAGLVAYGIKRDLQQGPEYVTLIPPPGIAGPEVAFAIPVQRHSEITVLKVLKTNRWPDPDITLLVRIAGTRLPIEHDVMIDLNRGNEVTTGVALNPGIYRRLAP